jgi:hypothetical protein
MAKKEVFTCDACGKDIRRDGPILVIQDITAAVIETSWDLCEECEDKIVTFIHSLGENK